MCKWAFLAPTSEEPYISYCLSVCPSLSPSERIPQFSLHSWITQHLIIWLSWNLVYLTTLGCISWCWCRRGALGSLWGYPGGDFGSTPRSLWRYFLGHFGVTSRVNWGHFEDTLGALWRYFWGYPGGDFESTPELLWRYFRGHFGSRLGSLWGYSGITLEVCFGLLWGSLESNWGSPGCSSGYTLGWLWEYSGVTSKVLFILWAVNCWQLILSF